MKDLVLFWPILIPLIGAVLVLITPKRAGYLRELITLLATAGGLAIAWFLFNYVRGAGSVGGLPADIVTSFAWCTPGLDFSLRLYSFSAFILLGIAVFSFLVTLFSWRFMHEGPRPRLFYAFLLISMAMSSGIVLANHLVVLLFFWEGLLITTFGMIAIGSPGAWKTATKAFIIVGVTDLCMLFGIALTGYISHTLVMTEIRLTTEWTGILAAALMMVGAVAKGGSVPFHTWIPDAAVDAPMPFMAFMPASLEKLLGIYFLSRISLDMFRLPPGSGLGTGLMILGAAGILIAVMMALIQKDYKRLLSYHAISQVGYMILGIGTALPAGIIGGLFHMLNNSIYKCCLFLTAGAVEKQTGTTDLNKLGGLGSRMPITFGCYVVAALSISGCPPFNGFFSKELIYDAALKQNVVFYIAALLGTFLTAASFLKLGHAAFLGKRDAKYDNVREAAPSMLLPMIILAGLCVLFGVGNAIPIGKLIEPSLKPMWLEEHSLGGLHINRGLSSLAVLALGAALVNHLVGARRSGSGLHAVDHIRNAPLLGPVYDRAERRWFDPYELAWKVLDGLSRAAWACDRGIDWIYDKLVVGIARLFGRLIRVAHTGEFATYAGWALAGAGIVILFFLRRG